MTRLFLPQSKLEEWALEERADLQDGKLAIRGETGSFPMVAAVHFAKLVSGDDRHQLLHRVKTQEQLVALGAEQMFESVVLGDAAYEVVTGYLAEVDTPPEPGAGAKPQPDALLADFILGKLN